MRLPNICSLLTASALLFGANSANALSVDTSTINVLSLFLSDNAGTDLIVEDGDANDEDTAVGQIQYSQDFGVFTLLVSTGQGDAALSGGDLRLARNVLTVTAGSEAAGELTVALIDPDLELNSQSNPVEGRSAINLILAENFTATAETLISTSTESIASLSAGGVSGPLSNQINDTERFAALGLGDFFDLVSVVNIVGNPDPGKLGISVNVATFDTTVAPVPLPAALPLFLTALLGLGFVSRHRRRQAA